MEQMYERCSSFEVFMGKLQEQPYLMQQQSERMLDLFCSQSKVSRRRPKNVKDIRATAQKARTPTSRPWRTLSKRWRTSWRSGEVRPAALSLWSGLLPYVGHRSQRNENGE